MRGERVGGVVVVMGCFETRLMFVYLFRFGEWSGT
jgi:hypothetical protein